MQDLWIKEVQKEVKERQEEEKNASEKMIQKDIEKGGDYYDIRLMLEDICKRSGVKNFIVKPFDKYHGPVCYVEKLGKLWMGKKENHFVFDYAEGGSSLEMSVSQMIQEIKDLKKQKVTSCVKLAWDLYSYTPPEGLFTKSPEVIAQRLKQDSESLKQAMSRLIFYINRAGDNLTQERRKALESTKDKLRSLFNKKAVGRPPKQWWDLMTKQIKKNKPSYSKEIVDRVVGDIWHNKIDEGKKRQLVHQYEK